MVLRTPCIIPPRKMSRQHTFSEDVTNSCRLHNPVTTKGSCHLQASPGPSNGACSSQHCSKIVPKWSPKSQNNPQIVTKKIQKSTQKCSKIVLPVFRPQVGKPSPKQLWTRLWPSGSLGRPWAAMVRYRYHDSRFFGRIQYVGLHNYHYDVEV